MSTLYNRKGIWYLRLRGSDGKIRWRSLQTRNRREAERIKKEADLIELQTKPIYGARSKSDATIQQALAAYLRWAEGSGASKCTIIARNVAMKLWLKLTGISPISKITRKAIMDFRAQLLQTCNANTVNTRLISLKATVARAIKEGVYIGTNPFAGIEKLKIEPKPLRWLSRSEIDAVLDIAEMDGRDAHLYFALGIFAGLRKGEIVAARWDWIDFDNQILTVQAGHGWRPKTTHGNRSIPIHPQLMAVLQAYKSSEGYIFRADTRCKGIYRTYCDVMHERVIKAAGINGVTPHTLRHTFASQLVQRGISLYEVATLLGHSDIKTTMIYAHLAPEKIRVDF